MTYAFIDIAVVILRIKKDDKEEGQI